MKRTNEYKKLHAIAQQEIKERMEVEEKHKLPYYAILF